MAKENGGVIGVLNTPTATTASGVWALQDQYEAKRNGTWPLTPFVSPNSARFNSGSSDYLNRTPASAGNRKTWTWSFWTKIPNYDASNNKVIFSGYNDANNSLKIQFANTDQFQAYGLSGGSLVCRILTNQLFRDYSAWYHIVYSLDTTQATSTNRQKLWVNGEEVTSFSTRTDPSLNTDLQINNSIEHQIGAQNNGEHYSNYMSEINFIDGQALTPSSFGASNASGVWYPIPYAGSYGTNGFNLKFTNASSLGTDSSPNGNNWTVNNLTSVDQSTDSPTNNFATLNPLVNTNGVAYTEGNLKVNFAGNTSWARGVAGSIVLDTGKWYWEVKQTAVGYNINGVTREDNLTFYSGQSATVLYSRNINALQDDGSLYTNGAYTAGSYTYATGDILMFALDMTNKKMYVGKNGTWYNSGNPSAGTASRLRQTPSALQGGRDEHLEAIVVAGPEGLRAGRRNGYGRGSADLRAGSGRCRIHRSNHRPQRETCEGRRPCHDRRGRGLRARVHRRAGGPCVDAARVQHRAADCARL